MPRVLSSRTLGTRKSGNMQDADTVQMNPLQSLSKEHVSDSSQHNHLKSVRALTQGTPIRVCVPSADEQQQFVAISDQQSVFMVWKIPPPTPNADRLSEWTDLMRNRVDMDTTLQRGSSSVAPMCLA